MAQLLTEGVLVSVDNLLDRVLEPVVVYREGGVVSKGPVDGIVHEQKVRIDSIGDGRGDCLRERLSAGLGVEASLGFGGALGTCDDAVKPLGEAKKPTAVVGDVDDELFGASGLEVL